MLRRRESPLERRIQPRTTTNTIRDFDSDGEAAEHQVHAMETTNKQRQCSSKGSAHDRTSNSEMEYGFPGIL